MTLASYEPVHLTLRHGSRRYQPTFAFTVGCLVLLCGSYIPMVNEAKKLLAEPTQAAQCGESKLALWDTFCPKTIRRRFVQDVWVLGIANIGAAVLSFIQSILVARRLGPEGYGIV